jgi:hypothetical protein
MTIGAARLSARSASVALTAEMDRICETASLLFFGRQLREKPRVRLAKACVRSMLSILLSYGAELGLSGCLELSQVLERMTLRVPKDVQQAWTSRRPTKAAIMYEHAAAIIAEGLRRGTRRHRSLALGVAA